MDMKCIRVSDICCVEEPNPQSQKFYELLEHYNKSVWWGSDQYSALSIATRLLSVKSNYNCPQGAINELLAIIYSLVPMNDRIPQNDYEAEKCKLYGAERCKLYGAERYKCRFDAKGWVKEGQKNFRARKTEKDELPSVVDGQRMFDWKNVTEE
ncbi:hypothetical protein CRG98_012662 [Punica granatum]|uniref:Uncharacterized protein n=1 Tax=Punica granatum TaxID=22663 RepID=A0A2I0KEG1_PUNGR|nr:hypothetical protein CRG98_012662 [Punica granatum]